MESVHTTSFYIKEGRTSTDYNMELTWQSPAPTRAKMQSRIEMLAFSQGTKEPTCAIRIITPTYQRKQNPVNC